MKEVDLVVRNATVVTWGWRRTAGFSVSDGRIVGVHESGAYPPAARVVDARGRWVMPGFVDAHFHCRAPDHPEREDFHSGTSAAAAGGVTSVLEMPVADVGTSTVERLQSRKRLADQDAVVDVGLFAGCGRLSRDEIHGLAADGAVGFKIFTHSPLAARLAAFDGLWLTENSHILEALSLASETGLPVAIHAEDEDLLGYYADGPRDDREPAEIYRDSRPPVVEAMAIARACILAEAAGARIHIVHVTSKWAVDLIRAWRRRGASVTAETCPHYMFYTEADMVRVGKAAKVAPPLRSAADAQALIEAVADGTLQVICSDHAPFMPEDREDVDYLAAPSGVPGVEVLAQLALSAGLTGRMPLSSVLRALTEAPASIYGIYPQKGALEVGADADFVIYDPSYEGKVATKHWHSRARRSAGLFEGTPVRGRIEETYVRGTQVYSHGEITAQRGFGEVLRPGSAIAHDRRTSTTRGVLDRSDGS